MSYNDSQRQWMERQRQWEENQRQKENEHRTAFISSLKKAKVLTIPLDMHKKYIIGLYGKGGHKCVKIVGQANTWTEACKIAHAGVRASGLKNGYRVFETREFGRINYPFGTEHVNVYYSGKFACIIKERSDDDEEYECLITECRADGATGHVFRYKD